MAANLTSLCRACHGLVHEGLLLVMGEVPDGVWFANRYGEPVVRRVEGGPLAFLARVQPHACTYIGSEQPAGGHPPRTGPAGGRSPAQRPRKNARPTCLSYDEIPAIATAEWLERHEHLIVWTGNKLRIKASALRCPTLTAPIRMTDPAPEPADNGAGPRQSHRA